MPVTVEELKSQLTEYRKASRAMMKFYDSAWSLSELFDSELSNLFKAVKDLPLSTYISEDWEQPDGVSFDAYRNVTYCVFNWGKSCCSNKEFKPKINSVYLEIFMLLDYWPLKSPLDSLSAIGIYARRIKNISGNATHSWNNLDYEFNSPIINSDIGIDKSGEPLRPIPIYIFPNVWSAAMNKYEGDYAVGLYDLSTLIDKYTVNRIIIGDIKKLLNDWKS